MRTLRPAFFIRKNNTLEWHSQKQILKIGGRVHAGNDVESGGLACAVGADQGDELVLIYFQVQVIHSDHAAKLHGCVQVQAAQISSGKNARFMGGWIRKNYCYFLRRMILSLS